MQKAGETWVLRTTRFRVYAIERELNATSLPAIISLAPTPAELACESSGLPDLELLSEGQGVRS